MQFNCSDGDRLHSKFSLVYQFKNMNRSLQLVSNIPKEKCDSYGLFRGMALQKFKFNQDPYKWVCLKRLII